MSDKNSQFSGKSTHDDLFKAAYRRHDGNDDLCLDLLKIICRNFILDEFRLDTLDLEPSGLIREIGREKYADLIFSLELAGEIVSEMVTADDTSTKFIVLLEHKSGADSDAMLQLLKYQSLLYEREGKRCRVLPVIVYSGQVPRWSGDTEFQESLAPISGTLQREMGGYFLNFRCKVVNLHEVIANGAARGLRTEVVLLAMTRVWDTDEETFADVFRLAEGLDKWTREWLLPSVVKYLLSYNEQFSREAIAQIEKQTVAEEARMMPALFEQIKNEGVEIGLEQGLEQGREQGLEQGREQGLKQGEKKALVKIAKNMILEGMDLAKVCKMSELSREQVEKLRNELLKH